MKVAVIGAGAWGTALSVLLATKGVPVYLWARRREFAEELRAYRENRTYLPGVALPALVWPTSEAEEALEGADLALVALPSRAVREILSAFPKAPLYVSAT
ncbi:MAG: glycerol-3-phosphate dehydrogenase, partial [Thermus sp.]|uniref:2-dehydropantoate 2-reductase N-terminal domain-containing protein n=1 Tax=Thermus sp. TaxID=275 RepID=UPI00332B0FF1